MVCNYTSRASTFFCYCNSQLPKLIATKPYKYDHLLLLFCFLCDSTFIKAKYDHWKLNARKLKTTILAPVGLVIPIEILVFTKISMVIHLRTAQFCKIRTNTATNPQRPKFSTPIHLNAEEEFKTMPVPFSDPKHGSI